MYRPRISKPRTQSKVFYLAFEGRRTEQRYFAALIKGHVPHRKVCLVRLQKSVNEISKSHPEKVLQLVTDYKLLQETGQYTTNLFISNVLDYLSDSNQMAIDEYIPLKKYVSDLKIKLQSTRVANENMVIDEDSATIVAEEYFRRLLNREITIDLSKYKEPFAEGMIEEYCIIVDRDEGSFKEDQVEAVKDRCKKEGYRLIITNPCFELWLMLHFPIPKETILRCVERKEMKQELSKYSKINEGPISPEEYVPNIVMARRKLNDYSQDLEVVSRPTSSGSETIGSNIGYLMDDIMGGPNL